MRLTRYSPIALAAAFFVGPASTTRAQAVPDAGVARPDLRPEAVSRRVASLPPPPEGEADLGFESLSTPGGLTAERFAAMAVASAPSVDRALAMMRGADATRDLARAGLYPQINVGARAVYFNHIVNGGIGGGASVSEADRVKLNDVSAAYMLSFQLGDFFQAFTNARFPFYRGQFQFTASLTYPVSAVLLQVIPAYRAAGHGVEAARLQYESELQTVWQQAQSLYYLYVRTVAAERIAGVSLEAAQAQLERMQALKDAGVVSNADLYRIEALVAQAEAGVAQTRTQRETAARALQLYVTGEDEALPALTIGEDFSAEVAVDVAPIEDLETHAMDRRTELRALRELYAAQLDRIRAARGARYPVVGVGADTTYANPNTSYFPQTRQFRSTWDINAFASWSPNDFARGQAQARQAASERDRVEAEHAQLVDAVRLEVAQARNNFLAAHEQIASARAELRAAAETYRARFEQLQHGTIETTSVVDAFTALANARLRLVDASIGVRLARTALSRATGEYAEQATRAASR